MVAEASKPACSLYYSKSFRAALIQNLIRYCKATLYIFIVYEFYQYQNKNLL